MNDYFNWSEKRERLALWGMLAFGFALRAAYIISSKVPLFSDMLEWDKARLAIVHSLPYSANWTPLYPAALALVTFIFGDNYVVLNLANAVFSTVTCWYIFLSAREVFGKKTAYLALLLSAVYVDMIWYCSVMLAETLGMMLLTILAYRIIKDKNSAVNGLVFGLTCMTKGLFLLCLPGLLFWIWYKNRPGAWLKKAALFSVFAFLAILPWSIRNMGVYKKPVMLEPHWAMAIFDGHNPYSTGSCDYLFLGTEYGKFYNDPSLSIVEINRICLEKSIDFALHNPLKEIQLTLLKTSKHLAFTTSFVLYRADFPVKKLMFSASVLQNMLLFPLCVLGMVFSFRDRKAFGFSILILSFVGIFITLFSAEVRKRMPFVPFMLILAAHGALLLPGLIERLRARDTKGIAGKLAVSAAVCALLYINFAYQLVTRWKDVAGRFN